MQPTAWRDAHRETVGDLTITHSERLVRETKVTIEVCCSMKSFAAFFHQMADRDWDIGIQRQSSHSARNKWTLSVPPHLAGKLPEILEVLRHRRE